LCPSLVQTVSPDLFVPLPGAGGINRGYKVALAKGLQLFSVQYPPGVDDPTTLLYPDEPHDEFGRLLAFMPSGFSEEDS
jgi:hypothetical protein